MDGAHWWIVGGVAVLLVGAATTVGAAGATSDGAELWTGNMVATFSSKVRRFADAIAHAEGFGRPGAVPTNNHNPGDLKSSSVPSLRADSQGHLVFATDAMGWEALHRQVQLIVSGKSRVYTSLDLTIAQMAAKYAPSGAANWAANVARFLNVSVDTTLREVLI